LRHRDAWRPSKYVRKNGRLIASRDPTEVSVSSRLMVDLIAEWYDANLRVHARGRLLDLGCGKVPLFEAYRDLVTDNVCVDWANSAHKNDYLDFEHDLTEELPFADAEFDTIVLSDVLEHIPEPERLCREMSRVLLPGGKLLMNVPFYYWIHEHPHDYYRYTEFALRRFMDRSGLRVLQIQAMGGAPEVLTDIFVKNVRRLPLGDAVAILSQRATAAFIRTSLGLRISKATGRDFPFGHFLVALKPE
jgi:SAM-dependent methyltransferase